MRRYSVVAIVGGGCHYSEHLSLGPAQWRRPVHDRPIDAHRIPHDLRQLALDRHDVPDAAGSTHCRVVFLAGYSVGLVVVEDVDVWHVLNGEEQSRLFQVLDDQGHESAADGAVDDAVVVGQ